MTRPSHRSPNRPRPPTGDEPTTNAPGKSAARLWSIQEASEFLGVPVNTLYQWRSTGEGPRAYKLGKHLRFDPADIQSWLETKVA